ncbi:MAG: class II fructose-bisphosphate aldolase, partial [Candidatus Pararuminococcus gallinarum]
MLVNLAELFKDAKKGNYAVGAFNTPTFEAVRAVIAAAEEMNCPVILDHAEGHEWFTKIEDIGPVMLDYARKA